MVREATYYGEFNPETLQVEISEMSNFRLTAQGGSQRASGGSVVCITVLL